MKSKIIVTLLFAAICFIVGIYLNTHSFQIAHSGNELSWSGEYALSPVGLQELAIQDIAKSLLALAVLLNSIGFYAWQKD